MNLYQNAIQMLLDSPESTQWEALRSALERAKTHLPVALAFSREGV